MRTPAEYLTVARVAEARLARHYALLLEEAAWLVEHDGMPLALAVHMLGLVELELKS